MGQHSILPLHSEHTYWKKITYLHICHGTHCVTNTQYWELCDPNAVYMLKTNLHSKLHPILCSRFGHSRHESKVAFALVYYFSLIRSKFNCGLQGAIRPKTQIPLLGILVPYAHWTCSSDYEIRLKLCVCP